MGAVWGYPFYRGLFFGGEPILPATMPHAHQALAAAGYPITSEAIFLTAQMEIPPQGDLAWLQIDAIPTRYRHETMRESWAGFEPRDAVASIEGSEVGEIHWVVIPQLTERLGAPCLNIWGLGVSEQHRQKGIGSALVCYAMQAAFAQGARFASVGTQLWNSPAHRTYERFGFTPHCLLLCRTWSPRTSGETVPMETQQ